MSNWLTKYDARIARDAGGVPAEPEAACRTRDGDREAAREYIAHAMALFHGKPAFGPSVTRGLSKVCDAAAGGCVDEGYELLIKCLRTGAVHGLRMVLVDGGLQIFPLVETLDHAPTTGRSLSRREACVLRMIARGTSNKCIAKSLGIAPETVKTHVKAILSKLEAHTRAQAVARAEEARIRASKHTFGNPIAGCWVRQ
jgi:DNA-binding CsgD family transcriptional regulator